MDVTGPRILKSHPELGAVAVDDKVRPWILLNEYPSPASVEGSIFISPEPEGGYRTKVKGKRIEVRFNQVLPTDRTVVITFGSGIKDVNGNQMDSSFILAFSTGENIDRAAVSGSVEGMGNPAATWIWAYPLSTFDNPDPRRDQAPFATQPHVEGEFKLEYLPAGNYRLFCVADVRRNRLWDSEQEAIAFPSGDFEAKQENPPETSMNMALCDLKPPALRGAQALHRQAIRCSFDEPVDISRMQITAQTADGLTLPFINTYLNPGDSTALLLTTPPQREGDEYHLRLDQVADRSGNLTDSLTAEVPAFTKSDTTGPSLVWNHPKSGQTDVAPETEIQVGFSEAVILTDIPRAVHLSDSASQEVFGEWDFPSPALGAFQPSKPLRSGETYVLNVQLDSLRDIFGNFSADSSISLQFMMVDLQELGSISGTVQGAVSLLKVVADRLDGGGGSREAQVSPTSEYKINRLPAGQYRLWIYQDRDGNGQFSYGRLDPFTFAEPFVVSDDTMRVRPRWDTEGVELFWPGP